MSKTSKELLHDFLILHGMSNEYVTSIISGRVSFLYETGYNKLLKGLTKESEATLNKIFCQAVSDGDYSIARLSAKFGATFAHMELHPLALFAKENNIAALHWLMKTYTPNVDVPTGHLHGENPISLAAQFGGFEAFKYLVNDHGAKFNKPICPGINNLTPLQIAAMHAIIGGKEINVEGCRAIVKYILKEKCIPISQLVNPDVASISEKDFASFIQSLQENKAPELSEKIFSQDSATFDELKISQNQSSAASTENQNNDINQVLSGENPDYTG